MRKGKALSRFSNTRGFTLVEALVAITMLAMVSVCITSLVFSVSRTSRMSSEQLSTNAIMRVVKENVIYSARMGADIPGNVSPDGGVTPGKKTGDLDTVDDRYSDLAVVDFSGQSYPEYSFDLKYLGYASGIGIGSKQVDQYMITIKRGTTTVIDFIVEVYTG